MDGQTSPEFYALLLLSAAGVLLFTAALVWRRRHVSGGYPVLIFVTGMFVWSLTYAIYWIAPTTSRIAWLNSTYFGVVIAPGAFFAFTLVHSGRQHWISGRRAWLLTIQPIVTLLLLWTDPLHGLFYAGKQTPESSVIFDGGPWFWFHISYSYGLMLIGIVLLVRTVIRSHSVFRHQAALVLCGGLLPLVSNIISLVGLNPLPGLDLTPLSFSLTGLIITYSLYRSALLDLAPVARNQIVERLSEAVIVVDVQGRIVDFNPAAAALMARMAAEQGVALTGSLVGNSIQRFLPQWNDWLSADKPIEFNITPVSGSGPQTTLRLAISTLRDRRAAQHGQILVLTDITDAKRQERDLRESLAYFQAIFEASNDALFICDGSTGIILDINQRASELYGYSREEIIGSRNLGQFTTGDEPYTSENGVEYFRRARDNGPQAFEWLGRTKDGRQIWLDMQIRYVRLVSENRFLVRVSDITERKRALEREFDLALEKERSAILSHFIQDASHEFLTPLASIQTGLYLLNRTEDARRREEKTHDIEREVGRISHLVSMLVSLTQLDSGIEFDPAPTDINLLVQQAVTNISLDRSGLLLEFHLSDEPGLVSVDRKWMHEALIQLLDNARRFTPKGGTITLRTGRINSDAFIEIRDTGIGLNPVNLERIFDRFFRLDDAHTSPGFGLGLPIAKRIVELHGGHLTATSEVGKGSIFTIHLPLTRGADRREQRFVPPSVMLML